MISIPNPPPRQPQVCIPYRAPGEVLYRDNPHIQRFSMDAETPDFFVAEGGLQLHIPANAFSHWGRKNRVHGEVTIALKVFYSQVDMLLFGRPTTSDGRLLEAAVQLHISATQDGELLDLLLPIKVSLPSAILQEQVKSMRLFSGGISSIRSINGQEVFDWKYASSLLFQNAGDAFCHFQIDRCGWWACQKLHRSKARKTMMSARIMESPLPSRLLSGFILFRDMQTIVPMYPGVQGFGALNIPEGLCASIFIFGHCDHEIYVGQSPLENTSNKVFSIPVGIAGKEQILAMLA